MSIIDVPEQVSKFYDQMLLRVINQTNELDEMMFGKITGYRKVKVPKYLRIKVPIIIKDYDDDSEYGDGSFKGFLITMKEIQLFRIGTEIEEEPIRKKDTGRVITWKRNADIYSDKK